MPETQLSVRLSQNLVGRLDQYLASKPALSRSAVALEALNAFLPPLETKVRAAPGAGQDEETGRAGRDFGLTAGRALAAELGQLISPVATELELFDGRRATLRTARNRNTQWGCLDSVLERVDVVICAYTKDDDTFQLWELPQRVWDAMARPASAGHKLHGKLRLISKSDAINGGKRLADIKLPQ